MSAFFALLIGSMVIGFAIRFRRRSPDEIGSNFHESPVLEITWTVIPLIIVLFTFAWGAKIFFRLYRPPAGAVEYHVTGKQWMWKTQHPTGQREINELHLPVGRPARLLMTSEDVIHSFYVPAFRAKADVIPGRYTTMWFTPTKPGRYHIFCAEYCGTQHSLMNGWVTVMTTEDYEAWLASVPVPVTPVAQGQQLFSRLSCTDCHAAGSKEGPALAGLYGREVALASGERVVADDTYLRESIFDPGARVVAGFEPTMPTFRGQVSEEDVIALISYIRSLPEAPSAVSSGGSGSSAR